MKYVILFLPTLLEITLIVLPEHAPGASTRTHVQRDAEIRELSAEIRSLGRRRDILEAEGRQFLPRGMGR